ncbi:MAG TPA: lipopolysaccharide biosynthesis protein [Gemmatimonadales bacterium]|nr:lipopolysaccharide biosynthesis protein [Gemmatimonadales bacterium]
MTDLPPESSGWRARFRLQRERLAGLSRSRLVRDHLMTLATEFGVLCASLVLLKLAALFTGPAGFGEYVLARRLIGFIQLPTLCGIGLALSRAVAIAHARGETGREWTYFDSALLVTGGTSLLVGLGLLVFGPQVAAAGMGHRELADLARRIAPGVAGLVLHAVAYGLLRGRRTMVQANLLQGINLGVIPLLAFLLPDVTVSRIVLVTGAAQLAVALGVVVALRSTGPARLGWRALWTGPARELLRYGAPRVPGEFMLGALGALPVTAAAHFGGAVAAGQIGLGQSVVTMLGAMFAPLGQVMLPSVSARVASGRVDGLARAIWWLTAACAGLTLLAVLLLELLASWLIPAVFGPDFAGAVAPVRLMALGAVPYIGYIVLRNVLDAIHAEPLNTWNLAAALVTFGVVLAVGRSEAAVAPATVAAMTVLGVMTIASARRSLRHHAPAVSLPDPSGSL